MNGVCFNEIHSYYDLNLILSECTISPATPKTNFVDVAGASKSIDLTEALGTVAYNDRTGQLVFSVLPEDDFEEKKSEISNFINGKRFRITLDKDPDWFYVGRCSINNWSSDKKLRQIVVDLRLHPYKYKHQETVVVCDKNFTSSMLVSYFLPNAKMPVIPTLTAVNMVYIEFGNIKTSLGEGTHQIPELCLCEGGAEIKVQMPSTSSLTIKYQEGSL